MLHEQELSGDDVLVGVAKQKLELPDLFVAGLHELHFCKVRHDGSSCH